jgi:tyrosinase
MATAQPQLLRSSVALHRRKNVARMTAEQLGYLRDALRQSMAIGDERGYAYQAGIHGLPLPMYCQHHNRLFLPWHRAYLYFFELTLQDLVPEVSLPWWNWASRRSHSTGLPQPYVDDQVDGEENPLLSAEIPPAARQNGRFPRTFRDPGDPGDLPPRAELLRILDLGDFLDFSTQLENIHDGVHVWVGGTMGLIPWAAYDPIFWAHHSMIDRLWRLWQLRHPGAAMPPDLLRQPLPPFPMTVADVMDVTRLGYDYAGSTSRPGASR